MLETQEPRKEAFILFGGVASGKTTLAETLELQGARVYSTDRVIYQRTLEARKKGPDEKPPILNNIERDRNLIADLKAVNVFDLMANQCVINVIARTQALITAIHLNISRDERLKRFQGRREYQEGLVDRTISILDVPRTPQFIQLHLMLQEKARYESIPHEMRAEFNRLIREFYRSGSNVFDKREPVPFDYTGIDYFVEFGDECDLEMVTIEEILQERRAMINSACS